MSQSTSEFRPIPLRKGFGNDYLNARYLNPPEGDFTTDTGVVFSFREKSLIFDTNGRKRYHQRDACTREITFALVAPEYNVKNAYFLINAGNSKNIYKGQTIGQIVLAFRDVAATIRTDLILGENIREWCIGNKINLVRSTSSSTVKQIWAGTNNEGTNAVIDCLSISIDKCLRNEALEKIVFVHNPPIKAIQPTIMGVHYSIFGITLEIE